MIIFVFITSTTAKAQEKWDLRKCIEYAITNNISVKQQDVQARFAKLTFDQSRMALISFRQFKWECVIGFRSLSKSGFVRINYSIIC